MWKITKALVNWEQKNSTRKMRNLALKMAHEDYVRLVKQIERAENPDRFVNRDSVDSEIEIDEAPISTKKATKEDWVNVRKHLDNKIYFKGNKSGNINADKGDIDTVIEKIESMPVLPKCVKISVAKTGNRKGLKTLFVNINSKYGGIPTNKKHAIELLAKLKFEAVMP